MKNPGLVHAIREDGRYTISISNPPDNIFSEEVIHEIADALEVVRGDDHLKLLVFTSGLPGVFSKGFNYSDRLPERVGPLLAAFGHMLYVMNEIPVPIALEIDGPCLGSGMELAAFCDIVVASERSIFGHPEVRAGIFPPVAAALYPHLMGRNRTMELLMTGRELDAKEAYELGLLNRIFGAEEFAGKAQKLYEEIERSSALTLRLTKKAIESALYEKVLVAIRTTENIYMSELLTSHDAREGIKAILEGRSPKWKDR
ncbi:MAG: enoyl-CoA hydratase/isomerase family protein [Candidatus Electryonea clarkiae]|nr:enoyl-CoA hydratase/isomerase family protein [Candidatus Electryonea clarkiae]MDP8287566.1 enoyl-CoA hydratase/isomerase family protein [Candidatus Electryonea clarkiae]